MEKSVGYAAVYKIIRSTVVCSSRLERDSNTCLESLIEMRLCDSLSGNIGIQRASNVSPCFLVIRNDASVKCDIISK